MEKLVCTCGNHIGYKYDNDIEPNDDTNYGVVKQNIVIIKCSNCNKISEYNGNLLK